MAPRTDPAHRPDRLLGLEKGLGLRLSRIQGSLWASWVAELAHLGLTPPTAAVLKGVDQHPATSIRGLGRVLGCDAMTVKRGVDDLEERGLVRTVRHPGDRRPRRLEATGRGRDLVARIDERLRRREALFDELPEGERDGLDRALAALEVRLGLGTGSAGPRRDEGSAREMSTHEHHHGEPGQGVPGHDAPGHDAPGHDAPGHDAHWHEPGDADPATTWDERYASDQWSREPDPELRALTTALGPGTALDLGAGNGRNAVWLAERGWSVVCVDASSVGLDQAAQRAAALGASLTCEVADLRTWEPGTRRFDLVVLANVHLPADQRAHLFSVAQEAVAPGGRLFVVGHHVDAFGAHGPPDPARLFTEELLTDLVDQLTVDELRTVEHRADHGHAALDVVAWAHRDP